MEAASLLAKNAALSPLEQLATTADDAYVARLQRAWTLAEADRGIPRPPPSTPGASCGASGDDRGLSAGVDRSPRRDGQQCPDPARRSRCGTRALTLGLLAGGGSIF